MDESEIPELEEGQVYVTKAWNGGVYHSGVCQLLKTASHITPKDRELVTPHANLCKYCADDVTGVDNVGQKRVAELRGQAVE